MGNLLTIYPIEAGCPTSSYSYDPANGLVGFVDCDRNMEGGYGYDGLGNRYRQTVNGATTSYLLDLNSSLTQVLGEIRPGDDTYYLLGLDVIGQQTGSQWSYFGYDGLGSVRQMTDLTGALTYAASFAPYGSPFEQYAAASTTLGFTGEQTDLNGLLYLRARYYDPRLGAFLSRDPVQGVMGSALSFNPYLYVQGNPINYVDPTGQFAWLALGLVALWFLRGATVDLAMQMVLEGRSINNLDLGSAAISGGIDVITGGIGSYFKAAGYAARTINRLDYIADVALSATSDVVFRGQDPLTAVAGNAFFGGAFRVGFHQGGRLLGAASRGIARSLRYADAQLSRLGSWYARNIDLNAVGSGPFPIPNSPRAEWRTGKPSHGFGIYRYTHQGGNEKYPAPEMEGLPYVGQGVNLYVRLMAKEKRTWGEIPVTAEGLPDWSRIETLEITFGNDVTNPGYWLDIAERIELFQQTGGNILNSANDVWPGNGYGLDWLRTATFPENWPHNLLPLPTDPAFFTHLPKRVKSG